MAVSHWLVLTSALVACGDNSGGPVPEVDPDCENVPWTSDDQFSRSSELGPVVPYTLRDFDASGRWFSDGLLFNNFRLVRQSNGNYELLDGLELESSSTELFFTYFQDTTELPTPLVTIRSRARS